MMKRISSLLAVSLVALLVLGSPLQGIALAQEIGSHLTADSLTKASSDEPEAESEDPEDLGDFVEPAEPSDLENPEAPGDPEDSENPADPQEPENSEEQPAVPALEVTVAPHQSEYEAGDTVHLAVTVHNTGTAALLGISVWVPLTGRDYSVPSLATGETASLEASFGIPSDFHMGYIGVGAYAECEYEGSQVSSYGTALVVVDEEVSSPGFKEVELPLLPDDWESVVPLDVIPAGAGKLQTEQGDVPGGRRDEALSGQVQLSSYEDTIQVYKTAERTQGCRAYKVTLTITGTPPPAKPVDVILVIDRSGSMGSGTGSPMSYAKEAAKEFAEQVLEANQENRVAVVSFAGPTTSQVRGSQSDARTDLGFSSNLAQVNGALDGLTANGGTNTQAGFIQARNVMTQGKRAEANKAIVFMTDGVATFSNGNRFITNEPIQHNVHTRAAYDAGISCHALGYQVFTVNLLSQVPEKCLWVARDTMQQAQNAGYYETFSAPDLSGIYGQISQLLNYSGKNAVVTDKIPTEEFEFMSFQDPDQDWASYDEATGTITWDAGTIGTQASLSYVIRAKAGYQGAAGVATNEYATLTYTDVNDLPDQTKTFPVPTVDVPPPLTVNAGPDREVPYGGSINVGEYLTVSGGTGPYTYRWTCDTDSTWSSEEEKPTVWPAETTEYTVTVKDAYGCTKLATVTVTVLKGSITVTKVVQPGGSTTRKFTIYVQGDGRVWSMRLAAGESATIHGLKANDVTYAISEVVPMDYRLVSISPSSVTIKSDDLAHEVTVTNRKVNDSWFRDDDEVTNTFTVGLWGQLQAADSGDPRKTGFEAVLPEVPEVVPGSKSGEETPEEGESHDGK